MVLNDSTGLNELLQARKISQRTFNRLTTAGFNTLENIKSAYPKLLDMRNLPGIGITICREIETVITEMDNAEQNNTLAATEHVYFSQLPEDVRQELANTYNRLAASIESDTRTIIDTFPTVTALHDAILSQPEQLCRVDLSLTKAQNITLRKQLLDFLLSMNTTSSLGIVEPSVRKAYLDLHAQLSRYPLTLSYREYMLYFLSPAQQALAEQAYQRLLASYTSKKVLDMVEIHFAHYNDMVDMFDKDIQDFISLTGKGRKLKAIESLVKLRDAYRSVFERICVRDEEEVSCVDAIRKDYPFLNGLQVEFVADFYQKHGHKPLFYLLYHFLIHSDQREDYVFIRKHRLINGVRQHISEIAESCQLSPLVISCCLKVGVSVIARSLTLKENWSVYQDLLTQPYL